MTRTLFCAGCTSFVDATGMTYQQAMVVHALDSLTVHAEVTDCYALDSLFEAIIENSGPWP